MTLNLCTDKEVYLHYFLKITLASVKAVLWFSNNNNKSFVFLIGFVGI